MGRDFGVRRAMTRPPVRLVTADALVWESGLEYALLAVRRLVDMACPVAYTIVGRGPEAARVLYTIHDLGLGGTVDIRPEPSSRAEIAADILLSARLRGAAEPRAGGFAEAGVPIVRTPAASTARLPDGGVVRVVPFRDPEAMAEAVAELLVDRAR